jgi:hypothetical protein
VRQVSKFFRHHGTLAIAYMAIGCFQILVAIRKHHFDDCWFAGLWIALGLCWLLRKPEHRQLVNLNLSSRKMNGESNRNH